MKKALSLYLQLYAEKDQITQVELKSSTKPGIQWDLTCTSGNERILQEMISAWIDSYLAGKQPKVQLPLSFAGMPRYSTLVLELLREVPWGTVVTYNDLAVRSGSPRAARAVGNACGRNPFLLFVPCHRVITSDRKLGGFACGIDVKRQLLAFEGIFTKCLYV